jgi:hypothetical protein
MQDMVSTMQLPGPFQRYDVQRFFHYADRRIAIGIVANWAGIRLRDVEAAGAKLNLAAYFDYCLRKRDSFFAGRAQQMKRQPGGSLRADTGQLA